MIRDTINARSPSGLQASPPNAVAAGDHVLAAADSPRTHAALRAAGYRVIPVATPEMRKADGALTCLSIVLP